MDHVVSLSVDQDNALQDAVDRSQDPKLTLDLLLAAIINMGLARYVDTYLTSQAEALKQTFLTVEPDQRGGILDAATAAAAASDKEHGQHGRRDL